MYQGKFQILHTKSGFAKLLKLVLQADQSGKYLRQDHLNKRGDPKARMIL